VLAGGGPCSSRPTWRILTASHPSGASSFDPGATSGLPETPSSSPLFSSGLAAAGGASRAIVTVPAMRPRALLGASCESNGSKEKTLKSGVVGSRALAGQGLTQANFTFRDPSRGSGTTMHVPSADPRTLQLHLREFPFSPPSTPLFAPLQERKGAGEILREILSSRIRTKSGGACSIGTRKGVSGSGSPRDRNGVENGGREDATFLRPPW
jgi:hypothetical protein